jgi:hypothetical protein
MLGLCLNSRPIALQCNFLAGPGAFAFKVAFDEAYGHASPGVLLEVENVRRVHELPEVRWMDSCAGAGPSAVKELWAGRRVLETLLVATGPAPGPFTVAALPLLGWLRRQAAALTGLVRPRRKSAPGGSS